MENIVGASRFSFFNAHNYKGRGLIATLKKHYGILVKLGIALQGYYSLIVKMVASHWSRGGMNPPIAPDSSL